MSAPLAETVVRRAQPVTVPFAVPASFVVRLARSRDMPDLCAALEAFGKFFGTTHSLFPGAVECTAHLSRLIEEQPFFVVRHGATFAGFIGGALGPHPYNSAVRVLSEMFWWVVPSYRGTRAGLLLLDAFTSFGEQYADMIVMSLETTSPVNDRCLTKRGFALFEKAYVREIVHAKG